MKRIAGCHTFFNERTHVLLHLLLAVVRHGSVRAQDLLVFVLDVLVNATEVLGLVLDVHFERARGALIAVVSRGEIAECTEH